MKLTRAQRIAFDRLRAMRDAGSLRPVSSVFVWGVSSSISTGVNTQTLKGLRDAGVIRVNEIWLRGKVSADLEVLG